MSEFELTISTFQSWQILIIPVIDTYMNRIVKEGLSLDLYNEMWRDFYGCYDCAEEYNSFVFTNLDGMMDMGDKLYGEPIFGDNKKNIVYQPKFISFWEKRIDEDFKEFEHFIVSVKQNQYDDYDYELPLPKGEIFKPKELFLLQVEDMSKIDCLYGEKTKKMLQHANILLNNVSYLYKDYNCIDCWHQLIAQKHFLSLIGRDMMPIAPYIDVDVSYPIRPIYFPPIGD